MNETIMNVKQSAVDYIHHIISTHHAFLLNEAPNLRKMISSLPDTPEAIRCSTNLEILLNDIDQHLMKEEHILFPAIEEIEMALIRGNDLQLSSCRLIGPIDQIIFEHNQVKEILAELDWDCQLINDEEFSSSIRALRDDLLEHIRIEEEELFPAAERLCPGVVV